MSIYLRKSPNDLRTHPLLEGKTGDISSLNYLDLAVKTKRTSPKPKNIETIYDLAKGRIISREERNQMGPAPLLPLNIRAWTWIKGVFSAIAEFFRDLFSCSDEFDFGEEENNELNEEFAKALTKDTKNPAEWDKFLNLVDKKEKEKIKTFTSTSTRTIPEITEAIRNRSDETGLKVFDNLRSKIRFEIMKVIQNDPTTKAALDPCLARLGNVSGIKKPAPLNNDRSSCYIDSLLQVLFASKGFIEILRAADATITTTSKVVKEEESEDAEFEKAIKKSLEEVEEDSVEEAIKKSLEEDSVEDEATKKAKIEAAKIAKIAEDTKKTEEANNHIVLALKNYLLGLEAGLGQREIINLRDQFRNALHMLPGNSLPGGVYNQQEIDELLKIVLKALKVNNGTLKMRETKVYELANFEQINENPQDFPLVLDIPPIEQRPLPPELQRKVEALQNAYDAVIDLNNGIYRDHHIKAALYHKNFAQELRNEFNSEAAPILSLQEVVDRFFSPKDDVIDPSEAALHNFREDWKDLKVEQIRRIADKETIEKARRRHEKSELVGQAPQFLPLFLKREEGVGVINNRKIVVPDSGLVILTVEGEQVIYQVVGIAAYFGTGGSGHYVANANIEDKWYHVDDLKVQPKPIDSPNSELTSNGRLYMLEKVG